MPAQTDIKTMIADELSSKAAAAPAVLLPIASLEILGQHGPVGLDFIVAQKAAARLGELTGCLVAPAIPYGDTLEFGALPSTVHVPAHVLEEYIYYVSASLLQRCGARGIVFLCTHSLNLQAAGAVCRRLTAEGHKAATVDWWKAVSQAGGELLEDKLEGTGHGSELITSVALAVCPEAVQIEKAIREASKPGLAAVSRWNGTAFTLYGNFSRYCDSGAWGSMHLASKEKGEALFNRGVHAIADFLKSSFVPEE